MIELSPAEKEKRIITTLTNYYRDVKALDDFGYFDEAKCFELFACELANIWFKPKKFTNANKDRCTEAIIDLVCDDNKMFIQVSAQKNYLGKIKKTFETNYDDETKKYKYNEIYFIFLKKDISLDSAKSKFPEGFEAKGHVISLNEIFSRMQEDILFTKELYELVEKYFFEVDDYKKIIKNKIKESKTLLEAYDNKIGTFKIERNERIDAFYKSTKNVILVSGGPGVGKTAFVRDCLENKTYIYKRAECFSVNTELSTMLGFNIEDFIKYTSSDVYLVIDSLEAISDVSKNKSLSILISETAKCSRLKIVFTCRTYETRKFLSLFGHNNLDIIELDYPSENEVKELVTIYPILDDVSAKYGKEIFNSLFIVSNILRIKEEAYKKYTSLTNLLVSEIITKNDFKRKKVIFSIISERVRNLSPFVDRSSYTEQNIIDELLSDEIVIELNEYGGIRAKYDIYEDLVFDQIITEKYSSANGDNSKFFGEVEKLGLQCKKRYQLWILTNLASKNEAICSILNDDDVSNEWKEQTLIGLAKSDFLTDYLEYNESFFTDDDYFRLKQLIHITNLYMYGLDSKNNYLKPIGNGRYSILKWIDSNVPELCIFLIDDVLRLLEDYCTSNNINNELVVKMLKIMLNHHLIEPKSLLHNEETIKKIIYLLLYESKYCKDYLIEIINLCQKNIAYGRERYNKRGYEVLINDFIHSSNANSHNVGREITTLALNYWTCGYDKDVASHGWDHDSEILEKWGLGCNGANEGNNRFGTLFLDRYFLSLYLLNDFFNGLESLIEFYNKIALNIVEIKKQNVFEMKFMLSGKEKIFYGNKEFWMMATGGGAVVPQMLIDFFDILEYIIFMFMDSLSDKKKLFFARKIYDAVVNKSNNIILFPLLVDLALKYTGKLECFAIDIFTNPYVLCYDIHRVACYMFGINSKLIGIRSAAIRKTYEPFVTADFRKKAVSNYLLYMQMGKYREQTIGVIDYLYTLIPNNKENAHIYLRIENCDSRKQIVRKVDSGLELITNPTGAAKEMVENYENESKPTNDILLEIKNIEVTVESMSDNNDYLEQAIEKLVGIIGDDPVEFTRGRCLSKCLKIYFSNGLNKSSKLINNYSKLYIDDLKRIVQNQVNYIDKESYASIAFVFNELTDDCKKEFLLLVLELLIKNKSVASNMGLFSVLNGIFKVDIKYQVAFINMLINYVKFIDDLRIKLSKKKIEIDDYNLKEKSYWSKIIFDDVEHDYDILSIINWNLLCSIEEIYFDYSNNFIKNVLNQLLHKYMLERKKRNNAYSDYYDMPRLLYKMIKQDESVIDIYFSYFEDNINHANLLCEAMALLHLDHIVAINNNNISEKKKIRNIIRKIETIVANGEMGKYFYSIMIFKPVDYSINYWEKTINYSTDDIMFIKKYFDKYYSFDAEKAFESFYKLGIKSFGIQGIPILRNIVYSLDKNGIGRNIDLIDYIIRYYYFQMEIEIKHSHAIMNNFIALLERMVEFDSPIAAVILDEFLIHN